MKRIHRLIAATALAAVTGLSSATGVDAQERRIGVEVGIGYQLPGGDDFDGFDPAFGFEALGSYAFDNGLELGLGAGFASHDVDGALADAADIAMLFGEGRYRFGFPAAETPHLHPFVSGRIGWSRIGLDSPDGDDPSATGLVFGGGGGIEYWITDLVAVVGAGTVEILSFGDSDDLPDLSGHRIGFRGGLKVRF